MARTARAWRGRGFSRGLLGDHGRPPGRDDPRNRGRRLPRGQLDGAAAAGDAAMRAGARQDGGAEPEGQGRPRGGDGGGANHGRGEGSPDEQRGDQPEGEENSNADDERTKHSRPFARIALTPAGGADELRNGEEAEGDEPR